MSARYKLLARDLLASADEGAKLGERDALHALRLGVSFNDWLTLDAQERFAHDAAHRAGLDWAALTIEARIRLVSAFNDAYRTAYGETYYAEAG